MLQVTAAYFDDASLKLLRYGLLFSKLCMGSCDIFTPDLCYIADKSLVLKFAELCSFRYVCFCRAVVGRLIFVSAFARVKCWSVTLSSTGWLSYKLPRKQEETSSSGACSE